MRVILTHHLTDNSRALHIRPVPRIVGLVHGKQHPPVHRLETVPGIRQRTPHDHAHCVIEVGMTHLFLKADRKGLFCELIHGCRQARKGGVQKREILPRRALPSPPLAPMSLHAKTPTGVAARPRRAAADLIFLVPRA